MAQSRRSPAIPWDVTRVGITCGDGAVRCWYTSQRERSESGIAGLHPCLPTRWGGSKIGGVRSWPRRGRSGLVRMAKSSPGAADSRSWCSQDDALVLEGCGVVVAETRVDGRLFDAAEPAEPGPGVDD